MRRKRLAIAVAVFSPLWIPIVFGGVAFYANRDRIWRRLTVVRLGEVARALETHRRRAGTYPQTLRALPPDVDTRDGWRRALRYASNGDHYELWTVSDPGLRVRDGVLQDIQSRPP
ncbi:MAG TPA: hypothetical protein VJZ76_08670 [Thermoanaerobaculia bacterium]|nr:hypothetical protein [Thermoanaerobaculia bacterium]